MDNRFSAKELLDDAIAAVRDQEIDRATIDGASSRAWDRISSELAPHSDSNRDFKIRGCSDIQALLERYKAGRLSDGHALIVQDHLRECMACQTHSSHAGSVLAWRDSAAAQKPTANHLRRYAAAAALLVSAGIGSFVYRDYFLSAPAGSRATVQSMDGSLYLIASSGQRPLSAGQEIGENQWIRTPRGSHAMIQLRDGSVVEMRERSEFAVTMNRTDTTVHLERGAVIVQAAHRRTGHLYVDASDCFVSVTGTVFAVDRGTKGSRVSVVEGEVKVQRGAAQDVLHSGDQIATNPAMAPIAVKDEIAWSRNLDRHLALLKEFSVLKQNLSSVRLPGLRYESRLLALVPHNTVLFASIPNYGQVLSEANQMLQDRIQQSPVLRDWWQNNGGAKANPSVNDIIERVRLFSSYLGGEIVLSASLNTNNRMGFVVMAEIQKPGLREFVEAEMKSHGGPPLRILTSAADLAGAQNGAGGTQILIDGNIIALSVDADSLRSLSARVHDPQPGGFSGTPYRQRISDAYREGAGLLFTADLQRIASVAPSGPREVLNRTGANSLKYLVFEQKEIVGKTENRAVVSFNGLRQGIASWLAAPAPMGSLTFVSSEATVAASFVIKNPSQVLDDLIAMASAKDPNFTQEFAALEGKLGIHFREDLANTLGSDATIALDGPALPSPSWKVSVEVNDPARLQQTIERLIPEVNSQAQQHGKKGVELSTIQSNGRTVYVLKSLDNPLLEPAYTFLDGYLIIASGTPVLNRAIRTHDNGNSLNRSNRFTSLLPTDGQTNFSALVYYNLGNLAGTVADVLDAAKAVTSEQKQAIKDLANSSKPTLIYAYGQQDQIQIATTGGVFGMGLETALTAGGLNRIFQIQLPGTRNGKASYK